MTLHPGGWKMVAYVNGELLLWNIVENRIVLRLERSGHTSPITAVAQHEMIHNVATGDSSGVVMLWDRRDGRFLETIIQSAAVEQLSFSRDGSRLLALYSTGELAAYRLNGRVDWRVTSAVPAQRYVRFAQHPADGLLAVGTDKGGVEMLNSDTGRLIGAIRGKPSEVRCVTFSPDGEFLAVADISGQTVVWNPHRLTPQASWTSVSPIYAMRFSIDNAFLIAGGAALEIRSVATGESKWRFPIPNGPVQRLDVLQSDGAMVVSRRGAAPLIYHVDGILKELDRLHLGLPQIGFGSSQEIKPKSQALWVEFLQGYAVQLAEIWKQHWRAAEEHRQAQRPQQAADEYSLVLKHNPEHAESRRHRGMAHLQLENWTLAAEDLTRAIELGIGEPKILLQRALALEKLSRWSDAVDDLSEFLKRQPDDMLALARRGTALAAQKEWDRALSDFSTVLQRDQDDGQTRKKRAEAFVKKERWKDALADCDLLLKTVQDDPEIWNQRALAYRGLEQWGRVVDDTTKAIALDGSQTSPRFGRAYAFSKLRQYQASADEYTQYLKLNPNSNAALNNRGICYQNLKQLDKALEDYNAAIAADSRSYFPYRGRANLYFASRQYEKAVSDYSIVLQHSPDEALYRKKRAEALVKMARWTEAIADYDLLLKTAQDDPKIWRLRALANLAMGQWDQVVDDETKAIALDGSLSESRFRRAYALSKLKKWQPSADEYTRYLELKPRSSPGLNNRGICYRNLKQLDKALEDYNGAIAANPRSYLALRSRGSLYLASGDSKKAIEDYSRSIVIKPDLADTWFRRAVARVNSKQFKQALPDYDRAIELDDDVALYYSNRGIAHANLKQWEQAIADYSRSIDLNSASYASWHNRGVAFAGLKQWDNAVRDYGKAVELNPKSWNSWKGHGSAYAQMGRWKLAAASLQKAIAAGPDQNDSQYMTVFHWRALVALTDNDHKTYAAVCQQLLERLGETPDAVLANTFAWTCCLAPGALKDLQPVVAQAKLAASNRNHATLNTLGAALYRTGQYEQCIKTLAEGILLHIEGGSPADWTVLAMAHHQLNNAAEAQRWLDKAKQEMAKWKEAPPELWARREMEILFEEAATLVQPARASPASK